VISRLIANHTSSSFFKSSSKVSSKDCTTCGAGLCFPAPLIRHSAATSAKPRFEKEVTMSALFGRFWVDDQGQDIEYAVMLAVVDEDVT
jgi:hypothetical protein